MSCVLWLYKTYFFQIRTNFFSVSYEADSFFKNVDLSKSNSKEELLSYFTLCTKDSKFGRYVVSYDDWKIITPNHHFILCKNCSNIISTRLSITSILYYCKNIFKHYYHISLKILTNQNLLVGISI